MLLFIIKLLNKWIKHRRLLRQFYIEIYTWVIDGCPDHVVFGHKRALCSTLEVWAYDLGYDKDLIEKTAWLIRDQFRRAGLSENYPFNTPLTSTYYRELNDCTLYKNPRRIKWLHDHALQSLW